ncbi:MAG: hypothetical protein ABGW78_12535, partial [Pirellulales bacterium]
ELRLLKAGFESFEVVTYSSKETLFQERPRGSGKENDLYFGHMSVVCIVLLLEPIISGHGRKFPQPHR